MFNDYQLFQVSLKLFLQNEQGETLLLAAQEESSMAGFYDLPGGRIDKSEVQLPFTEILRREVAEELGDAVRYTLNSERPAAAARHNFWSRRANAEMWALQLYFSAKYLEGEVKISDEHAGFKWITLTKDNAKQYFVRGLLAGAENYLSR